MNKKERKTAALKIVAELICQEIVSPTGWTDPSWGGAASDLGISDEDADKVRDEMDIILDGLMKRIKRIES